MSRWADVGAVVELLDRHFEYLGELSGTAQIIRLKRVLSFLVQEPLIAGVLREARLEAEKELDTHDRLDRLLRGKLRKIYDAAPEHIAGGVPDWTEVLGELPAFDFEHQGGSHPRHEATRSLISAVVGFDEGALAGPMEESRRNQVGRAIRLRMHHDHNAKRLQLAARGLAWPAFTRLAQLAGTLNPVPPRGGDAAAWNDHVQNARFAQAIEAADVTAIDMLDEIDVNGVYDTIEADARLVHEEVRFRLGSQRSRLALVERYAARCEAFDADRLRERCASDTGRAERLLTLDLARYLFDAGLTPLLDATMGGLRPDVIDVSRSSLFYVEAKQYGDEHPTSRLRSAYAQTWGTWARLRKTYNVPEAFLVVFRRAGPWVELPPVIRHDGLRLYSVVADISTEAGSRERQSPIVLTEDELRPQPGES
jgi:hypothetical protein